MATPMERVDRAMIAYIDGAKDKTCVILYIDPRIRVPAVATLVEAIDPPVTGNQAEYLACARAVRHALMDYRATELQIYSDSQLLVHQMNSRMIPDYSPHYRTKCPALKKMGDFILVLCVSMKITFTWVPREYNPAGIELDKLKRRNSK